MHLRCFRFLAALFLLCLGWGASLRADTLSGTVKDPAGLTVAGARIEITGEGLPQPLILTSDEAGKFVARDLKPGKYPGSIPYASAERVSSRWTLPRTFRELPTCP